MRRAQPRPEDPTGPQHNFWISVNDLMSSIIFMFLVILGVFSFQMKYEQTSFDEVKQKLRSPTLTRHHILKDLEGLLKEQGLSVEVLESEGILRLSENALSFPAAKALPNEENLASLAKIAQALTQVLPCYAKHGKAENLDASDAIAWCHKDPSMHYDCKKDLGGSIETVMIEGHTDSTTVRTGYKDNLALSAARATTVLRLMKSCDPNLDALTNSKNLPLFAASGYSFLRPLNPDNTTDPKNRRIDIRFVMDSPLDAFEGSEMFSFQKQNKAKSGNSF